MSAGSGPPATVACFGCGALVPGIEGPTHRYLGAPAGHLVSLHLVLERGYDSQKATRALGRVVDRSAAFVWLEPPTAPRWLTVLDVRDAADREEHQRRVRRWAESAWAAWSDHHETVRRWANLP